MSKNQYYNMYYVSAQVQSILFDSLKGLLPDAKLAPPLKTTLVQREKEQSFVDSYVVKFHKIEAPHHQTWHSDPESLRKSMFTNFCAQ